MQGLSGPGAPHSGSCLPWGQMGDSWSFPAPTACVTQGCHPGPRSIARCEQGLSSSQVGGLGLSPQSRGRPLPQPPHLDKAKRAQSLVYSSFLPIAPLS